jgi:predicted DCC family thiol-disulfide oxidoreductase YuxK
MLRFPSDSLSDGPRHPPEQPRWLRGPVSRPAQLVAHLAALPIRAVARERPPAVADPSALSPGDAPPTAGKLLLLFDGGCGICLHARDVIGLLDRRERLAFDRIARHDRGLLADLTPEERYGSWHVVHPDGRLEHGSAALATTVASLPVGRIPAAAMRALSGLSESGYLWFARNRGWISRGSGLINHPQRDPREQLRDPEHDEVVSAISGDPGAGEP